MVLTLTNQKLIHVIVVVQYRINCGANLENISNNNQFDKKPSETIIEVKAEEVK